MLRRRREYGVPPFIMFLMVSFAVIVIVSMLASVLFPVDLGATKLTNRLLPPSFMSGGRPEHLLGTDHLGRDFAIRMIYATKNSLLVAFAGTAIAMIIGTFLGVLAGLYRGAIDTFVVFLADVRLSIPSIIVAIVFSTIFGANKLTMILIIGLAGFAGFARLMRGQTIQLREANFIECSYALGASKIRVLFEHIFINISSLLIVNATMRISSFILLESSLSFIGLGIQPPDVSLGVLVSSGRNYLINNWWLTILPSMILTLIVLQVSLIGDWLRDKLDPKLKNNS